MLIEEDFGEEQKLDDLLNLDDLDIPDIKTHVQHQPITHLNNQKTTEKCFGKCLKMNYHLNQQERYAFYTINKEL